MTAELIDRNESIEQLKYHNSIVKQSPTTNDNWTSTVEFDDGHLPTSDNRDNSVVKDDVDNIVASDIVDRLHQKLDESELVHSATAVENNNLYEKVILIRLQSVVDEYCNRI
jgi:hypothetical protein